VFWGHSIPAILYILYIRFPTVDLKKLQKYLNLKSFGLRFYDQIIEENLHCGAIVDDHIIYFLPSCLEDTTETKLI
jgi:hypothetical protein